MTSLHGIVVGATAAAALFLGGGVTPPAYAVAESFPLTAHPLTNYCGYYDGSELVGYRHITTGNPVREVQCLLAGYGVTVDGIFGPKTQAAVIELQRQFGLSVDGIVGPQTWYVMRNP